MYKSESTEISLRCIWLIALVTLIAIALITTGCNVSIENIDMPACGCTDSTLEVGLDLSCLPYDGGEFGYCAALMPDGWSTDTVYYTGDCEGGMSYNSDCSSHLHLQFGEPAGYTWSGFVADSVNVLLEDFSVDVTMEILTDSVPGSFWLAFQTGWTYDPDDLESYAWDDPPHYGNRIDVSPLSFDQVTWGTIKSSLGQ